MHCILGAEDRVPPTRHGRRQDTFFAVPHHVTVPSGCGHFPYLEDPAAVTGLVLDGLNMPSR
jgi:pimeloyl-ACP methyl ester carboxylesterase